MEMTWARKRVAHKVEEKEEGEEEEKEIRTVGETSTTTTKDCHRCPSQMTLNARCCIWKKSWAMT